MAPLNLRAMFARSLLLLSLFSASPLLAAERLFDGKSLQGWEGDAKWWRVEDGALTGGSKTEKVPHNFFLATARSFQNFDLRLKLKLTGDPQTGMINSGVQIRSLRVPNNTEMSGYQVDAGDGWWGKMYDESRRNKVIAEAANLGAVNAAVKKGEWNEFRIRAEGERIQSWINGVPALDYTESHPDIAQDGRIAIQIHSGGMATVQVKDVTIDELPKTKEAPTWEKLGGIEAARAKVAPPKKTSDAGSMKEGNTAAAKARTPEEERASFKVPDGFEVELIAAEEPGQGIGKFVPIAFDQRGAIWTTTALEYPVDGNENPAAADALYKSKAKDKVLVYDRDPKSPTGYAKKARVFAEGLAIPLGVLPYKKGCYVQHGHDIAFLEDTDGDGKSDKRTVILTGFGVQDSHLFPHQFLRAPGGWIWTAQGLFNKSAVKTKEGKTVEFDMCRMAKFRPDGSQFEATSVGPNNIWGLVLNGTGEAFIQEANDYGYPVMPFHEYAYYPGGAERLAKSYQPPFPHTADFRMGGTGLSGLALTDAAGPFPEEWRDLMLVANPITNRIQAIKMHREGGRWRLQQKPDLLVSEDPWFRPVAITIGPDGYLYIVDWYNKIISHNEVSRNHPDRDKTRGRIWRVKPKNAEPVTVPDFTKMSEGELVARLGGSSLTRSHLAWQTLADRANEATLKQLQGVALDKYASPERRIQALWVLAEKKKASSALDELLLDAEPNIRREAAKVVLFASDAKKEGGDGLLTRAKLLARLQDDSDPQVRAAAIQQLGAGLDRLDQKSVADASGVWIKLMLAFAQPPLEEPTAPSSRGGKSVKVREAYDRDYERFLVRMYLEKHSAAVQKFLDSRESEDLPVEARTLAALALEPKLSAPRLAKLVPQLQRPLGQEELLRLAEFSDQEGAGETLRKVLSDTATNGPALEALLAVKSRLDAPRLAPLLADAASRLLNSKEPTDVDLAVRVISGFSIRDVEPALVMLAHDKTHAGAALRALGELGSDQVDLFVSAARHAVDPVARDEAMMALASSKVPAAPKRALELYPQLHPSQRRAMLARLSTTKPGASAIAAALNSSQLAKADVDFSVLDRLQAVLGPKDPALNKLVESYGALFRPVLTLDGKDEAWSQTDVVLEDSCTIETWMKLEPQKRKIGNADGIFGAMGQVDINFFGEKLRIYAFPPLNDVVVSKKPITPGVWTHVAATRSASGIWKLYLDGELDATSTKPAPGKIENPRIAWTVAKNGTQGTLAEFRIWDRERTADEVRKSSDRSLPAETEGLVFSSGEGEWGQLQAGAKIIKTSDYPPILSEAEVKALDAKYVKYRQLAGEKGDAGRGQALAAVCTACHLIGSAGGNIGPNLSGAGAMGTEAILRNILQPNAAMENGYRIYRVELKSGELLDALFVSEDPAAVVIRTPGGDDRRIPKSDVREAKFLRRSLMPEGLLDGLTDEQVRDLFAYLQTLK